MMYTHDLQQIVWILFAKLTLKLYVWYVNMMMKLQKQKHQQEQTNQ